MNKEALIDLQTILGEERDIHAQMVETALAMQRAIKARAIEELRHRTAVYDAQAASIEELEQRRLAACTAIGKQLEIPTRHMKLARILTCVDAEERESLRKARDELKRNITELYRVNAANRMLLEEALKEIGDTFEMITRPDPAGAHYYPYGSGKTHAPARQIVNRTA